MFHDLDLVVHSGNRVYLLGVHRKIHLDEGRGMVEADQGLRVVPLAVVGYMEQDPTMEGFATLGDYAASALNWGLYRVERAGEGLSLIQIARCPPHRVANGDAQP